MASSRYLSKGRLEDVVLLIQYLAPDDRWQPKIKVVSAIVDVLAIIRGGRYQSGRDLRMKAMRSSCMRLKSLPNQMRWPPA